MNKYKTTIKLQEIYEQNLNGNFKTRDERIKSKLPIIKIIKIALKHGCSFKVGWNDNNMNSNLNYIEITSRAMFFNQNNNRDKWESLKKALKSYKL